MGRILRGGSKERVSPGRKREKEDTEKKKSSFITVRRLRKFRPREEPGKGKEGRSFIKLGRGGSLPSKVGKKKEEDPLSSLYGGNYPSGEDLSKGRGDASRKGRGQYLLILVEEKPGPERPMVEIPF